MPIMFSIRKNPKDYDSDDVIMSGKFEGFGYMSKKDGKIGLIRCPVCGKENYAMSVATGQCSWCGFQVPQPLTVDQIEELKKNIKEN